MTATYAAAHMRHGRRLPMECAFCGTTEGRLDAALRHDAPQDHVIETVQYGVRRRYSLRTEDYMRLCRSCHRAYDYGTDAAKLSVLEQRLSEAPPCYICGYWVLRRRGATCSAECAEAYSLFRFHLNSSARAVHRRGMARRGVRSSDPALRRWGERVLRDLPTRDHGRWISSAAKKAWFDAAPWAVRRGLEGRLPPFLVILEQEAS